MMYYMVCDKDGLKGLIYPKLKDKNPDFKITESLNLSFNLQFIISALVASLTVTGKAFGKNVAKNNASKIVHIVANVLNKMHLN